MLDTAAAALLQRVLDETQSGRLVWDRDVDGWFAAPIGPDEQKILIRMMFIEATNQIGADPYFVEVSVPGWSARFAVIDDSDGWRAIKKILEAAFPGSWTSDANRALSFLDFHLPKRDESA